MPAPIKWTDETDNILRTLRGDGKSWDAIAAALQIARSAAIFRAHKIGLLTETSRLGPAARAAIEKRTLAIRERHRLRAHAKSLGVSPERLANRIASALAHSARKPLEAPVMRLPPPAVIPPPRDCQWPLNDSRPWHFCGAPPVLGKPYCAEHRALACVRLDVLQAAE